MHFVDDVDLELALGRRITNVVAQLAHLFDAVVARAVDLEHVETVAAGDFLAAVAYAAGCDGRPVNAIERFGQDARGRGFADSARPDEKIGVREPILLDRVLQRPRDVLLADEIVERLRAVFSRKNLVAHAPNLVRRGLGENRISASRVSVPVALLESQPHLLSRLSGSGMLKMQMKTAWTSLALLFLCAASPQAFGAAEKVSLIKIDGAIGPATASYISRSIDEAQTQNAQCLIIQLNTPGGLLDSTQTIVQSFLGSPVPVGGLCRSDGRDRDQCRLFHHPRRERRGDGAGDHDWCGASGVVRRNPERRRKRNPTTR